MLSDDDVKKVVQIATEGKYVLFQSRASNIAIAARVLNVEKQNPSLPSICLALQSIARVVPTTTPLEDFPVFTPSQIEQIKVHSLVLINLPV